MAVKPGDILRDKFRIDALIGRGGMGQVFAATDLTTRAQVAIKVVSRLMVDDVLMVRLHREAEAAARIRSDFVPRVLEVSDTEEGETFLVMERLIGEPLSQRIRDNGALPWGEVRRVGEDVLRGLIDAHTAGIVHRDLKPSNVFLALKAGQVRAMVLDFGVCKMDGLDTERLTGTGESIGTVAYMAPEQIRGAARVDERADLFAFGVLVFEMLCGRLPHDGPSQMAILASKLENPAARIRDCSRVSVPEGTDELVMRALARDPDGRFANAQDLLKAWRGLSKRDGMVAAGSTPPPARKSSQDLMPGMDPPTEVSRPPTSLLASLASGEVADEEHPTADSGEIPFVPTSPSRRGSLPPEPHPTQTSLTTHHTSLRAGFGQKGGARIALVLAACGLVAGVVVVGVSFTKAPEPRGRAAGASSEVASVTPAAAPAPPEPPSGAVEIASSPPPTEPFELDPTPETAPGAKPKPARVRAPRSTAPTPKSSGPRITSQPRY